jgi:cytosine/creatinine deaminase
MDALENADRQPATVYRDVFSIKRSHPAPCAPAPALYGIPRIIVGENRTFLREEELLRSRGVSLEVLQNEECIRLMEEFIRNNPALWNEDIGVCEMCFLCALLVSALL